MHWIAATAASIVIAPSLVALRTLRARDVDWQTAGGYAAAVAMAIIALLVFASWAIVRFTNVGY